MNRKIQFSLLLLSIAVSLLCACRTATTTTGVQTDTQTAETAPIPTAIPTPEPSTTPTPTPEPTKTPTPTPEPEEESAPEVIEEEPVDELAARTTPIEKTMYATQSCNVRSGDSTNYEKIGGLTFAQEVKVTGQSSEGWYRIDLGDGSQGYVSRKLLSESKPSAQTSESTNNGGGGNTAQPSAPASSAAAAQAARKVHKEPSFTVSNIYQTGDGTF
ncbi:MAG: SH3 domain-containing protein [Lachnospiraceae bacterium]|nr:SH3 domain-containing protein [Lachnospiraceae bacterium]